MMCDAEYDWYKRSFFASGVFEFEGRRIFLFGNWINFSVEGEISKFVS